MPTNNPLDLSDPQATDTSGNEAMSMGTRLAGEDLVNDVQKVEERYNYFSTTTASTTTIKTGAGFLHQIRIIGGTIGAVTIYDNTAGSGTIIVPTVTPTAQGLLIEDVTFSTGLTIVTAAATIITGSYR